MSDLCKLIWCALNGLFLSRATLEAEILVLRHQLSVLRRKSPKRLAFGNVDRLVFAGSIVWLVLRAPADGYTVLLVTSPNAINATLYANLHFNFIRDIAPVAGLTRDPNVLEVNLLVPAKTVVCTEILNPDVMVMKSAQDWKLAARPPPSPWTLRHLRLRSAVFLRLRFAVLALLRG